MDDFLKDESLDLIEATLEGKTGVFEKTYSVGELIAKRYRVEKVLGRGNIGRVYQVVDAQGRPFAVKTIYARFCAHEAVAGRLEQLVARLSSTRHHNLVPVLESGRSDDLLYLRMPLQKARPLSQALAATMSKAKKTGIPAKQIRQIVESVAEGCKAVGFDLPHLNLLPKNMFVGPQGLALADAGLMHAVLPALSPDEFAVMDGLEFFAPELKAGREVGCAADTFSLGALVYSLATVSKPPAHVGDIALIGELPEALADVIRYAMDPDPAERYPHVAAFHEAIDRVFDGLSAPPPKPQLHLVTPLEPEDLGLEEDIGDLFDAGTIEVAPLPAVSAESTTATDAHEAAEAWEDFRRDVDETQSIRIEDEAIEVFDETPEPAAPEPIEPEPAPRAPEPPAVEEPAFEETAIEEAFEEEIVEPILERTPEPVSHPEFGEIGEAAAEAVEPLSEIATAEEPEDVLDLIDADAFVREPEARRAQEPELAPDEAIDRILADVEDTTATRQAEIEQRFFETLDAQDESFAPKADAAAAAVERVFGDALDFEHEAELPHIGRPFEQVPEPLPAPAAPKPPIRPRDFERPEVAAPKAPPSRAMFYAAVAVVLVAALAVIYWFQIRPRFQAPSVVAPVVEQPEAPPDVIAPQAPGDAAHDATAPDVVPDVAGTKPGSKPSSPTEKPVKPTPGVSEAPTPPPVASSEGPVAPPIATPTPGGVAPGDSPGGLKTALTAAEIGSVMEGIKGRISYCFTRGLEQNPEMGGVSLVQFTIEPDGSVSGASVVESSLDAPDADECLRRRVLRAKFPAFAGPPKTVKFPFKYSQ
ncbi:MAG: AgmX/PglI C-terminal domain-containing protein [Deltaproteobacteria bacterium]|nr:AgmX/PglI C-terminal domain-containing protein [Deltaproteobacteria bacterium]